ncbi:MAG: CRISPR-associated endonuclease Cas1 1 [Turneriella sp.]|nr:CRISPR-associated endonuclease Cas1 1 [Turneriella sp.]
MRHLTVTEIGRSLNLSNELLQVREKGSVLAEYPLNRLRSIQVAGRGVAMSSNLLVDLSARGIPLFIIDFKGRPLVQLSGTHQHAVAALRRSQILYLEKPAAEHVARAIVRGKIKNQRAVLLYFSKGIRKSNANLWPVLEKAAEQMANLARSLSGESKVKPSDDWRQRYMGFEGRAAAIYWQALRDSELLPATFKGRMGRGATDVTNQCLNLGYSVLTSHVWHAVTLAGLEPYLGILHVDRPGKPSLILDLMEEYRPWVVDRNVIKLRQQLANSEKLDASIRKAIIGSIHGTFLARMAYHGKRLRLSAILQRQVYRLCGVFHADKTYKPYLFKW